MEATQDLQIGDVKLEGILTSPETDRKRISKEVEELILECRNPLAIEKPILGNLRRIKKLMKRLEKAEGNYPRLGLSFLNMSNKIEYQDKKEIQVPKFSIYPLDKNKFSMEFWFFVYGPTNVRVRFPNIPEIFGDELVKSTDLIKHSKPYKDNFRFGDGIEYVFEPTNIPDYINGCRYGGAHNLILTSHLNGLIPPKIKQNIRKAKRIFGEDNLYLIAETKPEEWDVKTLNLDPVVVGALGNNCFYIDKFDTTKLEDYIAMEFTF